MRALLSRWWQADSPIYRTVLALLGVDMLVVGPFTGVPIALCLTLGVGMVWVAVWGWDW